MPNPTADSRTDNEFDIAIIGASVAGATFAAYLGQSRPDLSIVLLDKSTFPRKKPCGEGLAASGAKVLASMGLAATLEAARPKALAGFAIKKLNSLTEIGGLFEMGGGSTEAPAFGISRELFDARLIEHCEHLPNVKVLSATRVRNIVPGKRSVNLECAAHSLQARSVVCASGVNCYGIPKAITAKATRGRRFGFSFHISAKGISERHIGSSRVFILAEKGYEIYLTPLADEQFNLAILCEAGSIRKLMHPQVIECLLSRLSEEFGVAVEQLNDPLASGPFPSNNQRLARLLSGSRIALLGDSLESFDPIGGLGMTHALLSARALADQLSVSKTLGSREINEGYRALRYPALVLRYATALSKFIVSNRSSAGTVKLLNRLQLFDFAMKQTRSFLDSRTAQTPFFQTFHSESSSGADGRPLLVSADEPNQKYSDIRESG